MGNETKVIINLYKSYVSTIKNSIGSNLFQNLYATVDGKEVDITTNGNLSCAYYASSILLIFKLIKSVHATVDGTVRDLKEFGWVEIKEPKIGAVLVWEKVDFGNKQYHKHIGFYIGEEKAISNDQEKGCPNEHDWQFNGKRKIEAIFWNPKLETE